MNKKFIEFAKVLLNNHYKQYRNNIDASASQDILAVQLVIYAERMKLMFTVDWSGEEYSNEIGTNVNTILKSRGMPLCDFAHIYTDSSKINRDNYLFHLFADIENDLLISGNHITFFVIGDDAYHFTVLSNEDFVKVNRLSWGIYGVYGVNTITEYDPRKYIY